MRSDAAIALSESALSFLGLAITLTLLGINLFADAMRDAFDPRMRRRA